MTLVATVLPADDEDDAASAPIVNDGWLPDVEPTMFRAQQRIRDSVTPARAREALIAAMLTVRRDLAAWIVMRRADGADTMEAVPADRIDATSVLVLLYRRAVFTAAKAELVERYRDVDLTPAGKGKVDDLEPSVGELRRDSLYAVRDILAVGRVTVELI